jgi:methionyl aminopeptidase
MRINSNQDAKTEGDIDKMRAAGKAVGGALTAMALAVDAGVYETLELDRIGASVISDFGATPAFLNYQPPFQDEPYLFSTCISVNDQIVHGTPSARKILRPGDIVSLDAGASVGGWFADAAVTVVAGRGIPLAYNLNMVTRSALFAGIKAAKVGSTLGDVGYAISEYVKKHRLHVADGLSGHFIGSAVHMEPAVPNVGRKGRGLKLTPGMTFCIEPMVAVGGPHIRSAADNLWDILTADGSIAAHWEHTVLITDDGPEILTLP